jgi:general secretion pathway protein D
MRRSNQLREFLGLWLTLLLAMPPQSALARTKKGEKLLKDGQLAEFAKEYDKALTLFEEALKSDPGDQGYQLAVRRARFAASQAHVDKGQNLRKEGKLDEAIAEFQRAYALDPASMIAEQELRRTYEIIQRQKQEKDAGKPVKPEDENLTSGQLARKEMETRAAAILPVPELRLSLQRTPVLKMNNQSVKVLWESVGKVAGVNVLFDQDFLQQSTRNFSIDLLESGVEEAFDQLAVLTKAYWKPLSANTIFVTQDQITKRRDYEEQMVKTFYLQNVTTPQELQEIATVIRSVTDIRRALTYNGQMALTVRGSVDQVNLAQKLIIDLDKPKSEVVIDVLVMEANRTKTRDLAAAIATGGAAGLRTGINFTPRNPVLTGSTSNNNGNNNGATTTTTNSGLISLARVGRISTNDYSVTMPGALLNAVLQDRQTRVLQNPSVRTLDNYKVTLKIGDKYPYATGSFQPGVGAVGVSPLVSTQFQFADVGVNIDLTPKIHGAEEISMHIEVEVSNIRDNIDVGGLRQPVIGTRRITEDVRVKEGEVTLLGGLTTLNTTRNIQGIPGLATLPGVGKLFGTQSDDNSRSELLVALVPRVVRAPEINEVNLRGIAAGNDQTVKLSYAPREPEPAKPAPTPDPAKPQAPPATVPNPQPPAQPDPPPAPAAQLLLISPNPTASVGQTVSVTVQANNISDVFGAPLKAKFDPTMLQIFAIQRGPLLASDGQSVAFEADLATGAIRTHSRPAGSSGISGAGPLVTFQFRALKPGQAVVTLEDVRLVNSRQEPVPAESSALTVTIQ